MRWRISNRADPITRAIADRHYSRQKPGSLQFVPPGRCLVLRTESGDAFWVTSWPFAEFVKHRWAGAWVCSAFRNESPHLSSELIQEAVAATRWYFDTVPAQGFITFVDASKVRHKRDPGRCYVRAGWMYAGHTKGGLIALTLLAGQCGPAQAPLGANIELAL